MTRVEVLVLAGASPSSVAITCELLQTANRVRAMAERPAAFGVRLTGSGAETTRAMFGPALESATMGRPDVVIVPGLALATEAALSEGLRRRDVLAAVRNLAEAHGAGAEVACSCSAVFLAAAAGLLDGRRATTSWWLAPFFRKRHPAVCLHPEDMLITEDRVTTGGAAMAQMDVMLSVIARHAGADLAEACARYMLLDWRASQARYMAISYLGAADDHVSRAQSWAVGRLGEAISTTDLARAAGMTPRTFARRLERVTGLSPIRFLQRLRVERATELLETTRLSFEEIASRVGYAEPSTLRRLLRRDGGRGARDIRSNAS